MNPSYRTKTIRVTTGVSHQNGFPLEIDMSFDARTCELIKVVSVYPEGEYRQEQVMNLGGYRSAVTFIPTLTSSVLRKPKILKTAGGTLVYDQTSSQYKIYKMSNLLLSGYVMGTKADIDESLENFERMLRRG